MADRRSKTLVFIPTYNERDNVLAMVEELVVHAPEADLVFMDDNSPDGTGRILDEIAAKQPRLQVVHRPGKLGIGRAHLDGIAYAYDHGYETLVTLDCDFTHSPSDIPTLIATSAGADIALGSRHLERDSLPGWSVIRKVLTKLGHVLTVSLLGIGADATGAFRVYRLSRIPRELFDLVRSHGYAFFFESLFVAYENDLRILEVPIRLPARTVGHSKMTLREIQRSLSQLVRLAVESKTHPDQFRLKESRSKAPPR
jgi:dolichol-phosphate mannosyltransferase